MHSHHPAGHQPGLAQPVLAATDLIVATANPQALDATVQQLGTAVVVDGSWDGETCRVRVFGDPGYIRFAITNQGYGRVVAEEPVDQERTDAAR